VKKVMPKGDNKNSFLKSFALADLINRDDNLKRLLYITIFLFVSMSVLAPDTFLTFRNFSSMAYQFPEFGLLSIAIMLAMLSGGIDLSVVGIANLSGIIAAIIMTKLVAAETSGIALGLGLLLVVLVAISIGILAGLLNGFLISKIGITPILATLGSMELFTGIAIVITKGYAIYGFPEAFLALGNGSLFKIPAPFIVFFLYAIAFSVLLNKTTYGFKLYMMGTNEIASRFSGLNNVWITIKTYVFSGILAASAGLILIARTNAAKADYGSSYTLQAILVVVLGGVNPNGGFGTVLGVILSVLSLQFLSSGFNMLNISSFAKNFVWGALMLVVIASNYYLNKRKEKKAKESA
jgi:simple sugar transport system permease protein